VIEYETAYGVWLGDTTRARVGVDSPCFVQAVRNGIVIGEGGIC
jgi:hypothetical protein